MARIINLCGGVVLMGLGAVAACFGSLSLVFVGAALPLAHGPVGAFMLLVLLGLIIAAGAGVAYLGLWLATDGPSRARQPQIIRPRRVRLGSGVRPLSLPG